MPYHYCTTYVHRCTIRYIALAPDTTRFSKSSQWGSENQHTYRIYCIRDTAACPRWGTGAGVQTDAPARIASIPLDCLATHRAQYSNRESAHTHIVYYFQVAREEYRSQPAYFLFELLISSGIGPPNQSRQRRRERGRGRGRRRRRTPRESVPEGRRTGIMRLRMRNLGLRVRKFV